MPPPCRIGLIALASDQTVEQDLRDFLTPEVAQVFTTRIVFADRFDAATLGATGDRLAEAAALLLPEAGLEVLAYGCTSASVVIGEREVQRRLETARPGVRSTTPITAALAGLAHFGVRRLALLTPYSPQVHALVARHLEAQGLSLTDQRGLGLDSDAAIAALPAADLRSATLGLRRQGAEAVFVSCTALRTAGLVEALEAELGCPLVTSNQAMAWHALRLAGRAARLPGRGRLLRSDERAPPVS